MNVLAFVCLVFACHFEGAHSESVRGLKKKPDDARQLKNNKAGPGGVGGGGGGGNSGSSSSSGSVVLVEKHVCVDHASAVAYTQGGWFPSSLVSPGNDADCVAEADPASCSGGCCRQGSLILLKQISDPISQI